MELRDFIVTPIVILLVFIAAYVIRPYVTDPITRRYFLPALTVRMLGAVALGFIYQFYYHGGDTYNYHTYGSRVVWESFFDDPGIGLRLIFGNSDDAYGTYGYTGRILFYHDPNSFFIIKIAAIFDLITFSTYSATAILFSVFSFTGMWMFFLTFYKQYPESHLGLAIVTFFVPSVFFWGSGLLKDTIVLGCLGIVTYQCYQIFFERRVSISAVLILGAVTLMIFNIRLFILQAFLPAIIIWIIARNFTAIRSTLLRIMVVPFALAILLFSIYYAVVKIGENDTKYSIARLTRTAQVTAYDIGFYTGREAGSTYALDISSWTPLGMLQVAPAAINVALFRPYLWEARNPLMLISAFESTFMLLFSFFVVARKLRQVFTALKDYNVLFCLAFSLTFAFAVGISTFNFGTLTRYRIVIFPFYLVALIILNSYSNNARKLAVLESTE